ncbi:MAG: helix-turn-helix domain-containing protein [Clostridia bacterium]
MQVFTVKEVANYLSCSASSIRGLVRNKEIPYFRIRK